MKIKTRKESHYAEKKVKVLKKCDKCNETVLFENMYIAHNGPYVWNFCTECIHSVEEAKKESLIKRPVFQPVTKTS